MTDLRRAYRQAGVDVAAGDRAVALLRERLGSSIGGFASVVPLPAGYREAVLVSATDGVGTKTAIASRLRRYDTIGQDLVAMCADDVVCHGARPLFFLDYVAAGRVEPVDVAELVGSVAAGCRMAGCILAGGETAEHPGLIDAEEFDLAGFCVGIAERADVLDGSAARAGDVLIGIESSGLHANGFSLVRDLLSRYQLELERPYLEVVRLTLPPEEVDRVERDEPQLVLKTLGEVLLTPTRIYTLDVLELRERLRQQDSDLHGLAHITGGGLRANVPRALPESLTARVHPDAWRTPSVFRVVAELAEMDGAELRATLNAGIGMVAVLPRDDEQLARELLDLRGLRSWTIGDVIPRSNVGERYEEAGR